jgi:hypothetical protein
VDAFSFRNKATLTEREIHNAAQSKIVNNKSLNPLYVFTQITLTGMKPQLTLALKKIYKNLDMMTLKMPFHKSGPSCPGCDKKKAEAHLELAQWFDLVKQKYENAHISWAYRGMEDQEQCVRMGRSKLNYPKSPHNKCNADGKPEARALDLFQIDSQGKAKFDPIWYARIADEAEKTSAPIRWGGTFKTLGDYDHFELKST